MDMGEQTTRTCALDVSHKEAAPSVSAFGSPRASSTATKQDTLRDIVFESTLRGELARTERRLHSARLDAASNGQLGTCQTLEGERKEALCYRTAAADTAPKLLTADTAVRRCLP